MIQKRPDRLIKILLTINYSLIGVVILALIPIKNEGFEISIYRAVPSYIWYFLVLNIFLSILIIVYQAYSSGYTKSWWIMGMSTIMLGNLVILLLPVFRGYVIYGRWDMSTHVGYIKDILQFGYVPKSIIYPASHILISSISIISNVDGVLIINYIIPLFIELYILYMYCLAKTVFTRKKEIIISTVASSILFLSYTNYQVLPNTLSILFLPMIFYVYLNIFDRVEGLQFKIILIIFILFLPFLHPLTTLILVITFIGTYFLMYLYNKKFNMYSLNGRKMATSPALIGSIIFILWISKNYRFWNNNINQVANWFLGEATVQVQSKSVSTIFEKLNMKIFDILELFIKSYGHIFLYLILSCIAGIIILRRIFWYKDISLHYLYFLLGWFSIYNLFFILHMFSSVLSFGFWRILAIMVVTTPIFFCYVINKLDNFKGRHILILILFVSSIIGVFNTFPSPYTLQVNQQVTRSEITGMDWYYFNKNSSGMDLNIKSCFRYADFVLGFTTRYERGDILGCERIDGRMSNSLKIGLVPKHFLYTNFSRLSDFMKRNNRFKNVSYMPIFKFEKIYYTEIYPQLDEFNIDDFEKLNYDTSLGKIYDDKGVEIWKIKQI